MTALASASGEPSPPKVARMQITGRHVLFTMLGFFGVIIATDAYLVYKAVSTFGGIETNDAYRKGLAYNERIAEERAQQSLRWTKDARLEKGELRVTIRDQNNNGVENLRITAVIGRPATNAQDRTVQLTQVGSGEYTAAIGEVEPGTWVAAMEAREAQSGSERLVYQSKVRLWKAP
ncbi:MAG: FixH family protein [Hyphomicrobium sp.]|jgi:nitrogen fixation protein FixH|nr:FixH family protein [Hyphomicrobium sp.]